MSTPDSVSTPTKAPEVEELKSFDLDASVQPRRYDNQLTPPANFNFWSRREYPLFSGATLKDPNNSSNVVTVNWKFTLYIYATGAPPDSPDFSASGGVVYFVFVHQGDINSTLVHNKSQDVTLIITSDAATPERQLPEYSEKNGDNWPAKIDYHQTMQMFKNGGNEVDSFEAAYTSEFQLLKMEQTGTTYNDRLEIHYRPLPSSAWKTPREINGLSVFSYTKPRSPLTFSFRAVAKFGDTPTDWGHYNMSIPLGF